MAISAPALDLSTTQPRPFIRIDSLDYDLRIIDDFTALELRQLDRVVPRLTALVAAFEAGAASAPQCAELSALLAAFVPLVFVAPMELVGSLGDATRIQIFQVFMQLLPPRLGPAGVANEAPTESPLRGIRPSLGSSVSTGETLSGGLRRSRSGSSDPSSNRSRN